MPWSFTRSLGKNEVYSCESIVHSVQQSNGSDFAVIKLDRPVLGRMPLTVRRSGLITEETPLMVIGHPFSLPTKVAGGASVRKFKMISLLPILIPTAEIREVRYLMQFLGSRRHTRTR